LMRTTVFICTISDIAASSTIPSTACATASKYARRDSASSDTARSHPAAAQRCDCGLRAADDGGGDVVDSCSMRGTVLQTAGGPDSLCRQRSQQRRGGASHHHHRCPSPVMMMGWVTVQKQEWIPPTHALLSRPTSRQRP
jgi:hypothetical protein